MELGWHPDWVMDEFTLDELKEFVAIRQIENEDADAASKKASENT